MTRPDRTFALLVGLSSALIVAVASSTHHLLLAGAPTLATGGAWPSVGCLLLPLADDFAPHLASYAFLLATAGGAAVGLRTLARQHRQTRALLGACLAARTEQHPALTRVLDRVGLQGRLDAVELEAPIAFCYGYLHPRVLVSSGLVALLAERELEVLLLHEREHLRRRDPLKVAVGRLLVAAVFFVPFIGGLYRRYLVEKELAADRAAIAAQGDAASLSTALVRLVERGMAGRPPLGAGAGEALEARIDALLGEPVRLKARVGPGGFAASVIVATLAALPLLATSLPPGSVASDHNVVAGCHLAPR